MTWACLDSLRDLICYISFFQTVCYRSAMAHLPVIPADCPLFEAPICFRFALIHSIENAATNYLPTNWKGFADHFMLSVDASIFTPADLIHHWVDKHQNKQRHTISRVLEYAVANHHKHLEQEFDRVLSGKIQCRTSCTCTAHLQKRYNT